MGIVSDFVTRYYYFFFILLLLGVILAAGYGGFLLGAKEKKSAVVLQCSDDVLSSLRVPVAAIAGGAITRETQKATSGTLVGSKNGTKYYQPQCAAVKRIKVENYVWFKNAEDAQLQGYTKGAC